MADKEKKLSYVLIACLVLPLIYYVAVEPLLSAILTNKNLEHTLRDKEISHQLLIYNAVKYQKMWERFTKDQKLGHSEQDARALIQEKLAQWESQCGLTSQGHSSGRVTKIKEVKGFKEIIYHSNVNGSYGQMMNFIKAIEQASIPIKIKSISLSVPTVGDPHFSMRIITSTIYSTSKK